MGAERWTGIHVFLHLAEQWMNGGRLALHRFMTELFHLGRFGFMFGLHHRYLLRTLNVAKWIFHLKPACGHLASAA
jgi:hypothetical protein